MFSQQHFDQHRWVYRKGVWTTSLSEDNGVYM